MPILSVIIPAYNAQDYLSYCIASLLGGGDDLEILIVNDGSTDETADLADHYQALYPQVKVINQANKGHGGAVNAGLAQAVGTYVKVLDSDDWLDARALLKVVETLKALEADGGVDLLVTNFVYEKEGAARKTIMAYGENFEEQRVLTWQEAKPFKLGKYLMMHSLIYRLDLLVSSGLVLPEHTFYVDNLYVFVPLQKVEKLYYLNLDFYRYFIGREDQSVNETVMIKRIDQQLKVNRLLLDAYPKDDSHLAPVLRQYLRQHLEITTVISSALLNKAGTKEALAKKELLWADIQRDYPHIYAWLGKRPLGRMTRLPGAWGVGLSNLLYGIAQKRVGFN